jgi:hypothetical protein
VRDVLQYFAILDSTIRHSAVVDAEVDFERRTQHHGKITGTLQFADGSRLRFREIVTILAREPVKQRYSYQYLQEAHTVFRYDNSPHHRGLPNFPHHKHVGRKVVGAIEPMLGQVLKEILTLMGQK